MRNSKSKEEKILKKRRYARSRLVKHASNISVSLYLSLFSLKLLRHQRKKDAGGCLKNRRKNGKGRNKWGGITNCFIIPMQTIHLVTQICLIILFGKRNWRKKVRQSYLAVNHLVITLTTNRQGNFDA